MFLPGAAQLPPWPVRAVHLFLFCEPVVVPPPCHSLPHFTGQYLPTICVTIVTKWHRFGWGEMKQKEYTFLQFWRLESQDQRVGGLGFW